LLAVAIGLKSVLADSQKETLMFTLCIRYTLDPNRLAHFRTYTNAEMDPIRRSGGKIVGYFLPTEFAGPTNEAFGLIEFTTLADYERYRGVLAGDAAHKENVARLEQSGAVVAMNRSIVQRVALD
jgi:hypothetical protein